MQLEGVKSNEESSQDTKASRKRTDVLVIGIHKGVKNSKEAEIRCKEIMTENLPSLEKDTATQPGPGRSTASKLCYPAKFTARLTVVKQLTHVQAEKQGRDQGANLK